MRWYVYVVGIVLVVALVAGLLAFTALVETDSIG